MHPLAYSLLRWRLCIQPSLRHCTDQHLPWSHCTHNPSSSSSIGNIPSAEVHPIQLSYPLISNHWCHPWLFHARICGLILGSVLIVWVNTMPIWDTVLTVLWHFKLTALSHPLPGLHPSLIITHTHLLNLIFQSSLFAIISYSAASLSYVFYACSLTYSGSSLSQPKMYSSGKKQGFVYILLVLNLHLLSISCLYFSHLWVV